MRMKYNEVEVSRLSADREVAQAERVSSKKSAICTFLGSEPVQTVASQRNRDRVRSCCA